MKEIGLGRELFVQEMTRLRAEAQQHLREQGFGDLTDEDIFDMIS